MPASARLTLAAVVICGLTPVTFASDVCPLGCSAPQTGSTWQIVDVSVLLNSDPQWLLVGWTEEVPVEEPVMAASPVEAATDPQLNLEAAVGPSTAPVIPEHHLISTTTPQETADDAEETLDVTVAELFEPMRSVQVSGSSSIPPTLPNDADVSSLPQPEDQAGSYMETAVRACYYTRGYGVRRPPRNTWRFYCHPLYYEDVNLERCGRSNGCCTTACSALHFASRAAITPYLMTLQHHDDCVRMLPDCPTCHEFGCDATCPEWSWKAALVQGAAVTGLIYAIP